MHNYRVFRWTHDYYRDLGIFRAENKNEAILEAAKSQGYGREWLVVFDNLELAKLCVQCPISSYEIVGEGDGAAVS